VGSFNITYGLGIVVLDTGGRIKSHHAMCAYKRNIRWDTFLVIVSLHRFDTFVSAPYICMLLYLDQATTLRICGAFARAKSIFSSIPQIIPQMGTTRKMLIVGAPKRPIAGALEPAGGNMPVIIAYCRRTSWCAGGNSRYPRRTCLVRWR
jgi:hypothetical protein